MVRPAKTQWDFGELFPVEQTQQVRVFSVTELTAQIRRLLEKELLAVRVTGEITNLRAQASGHTYFTLKDAGAQLSCVVFRSEPVNRALLQEGRKVILQGQITVYEPRGQYQLRVTHVELQGLGALQAAFERLKQKLKTEGLFAQERKRPLPRYPQRIGLVTSPSGAAIRDVLHVIERRNPALEVVLAACRVQGQGAAEEIAAAIRLLNEFNRAQVTFVRQQRGPGAPGYLDLILVTRGGGSLEDLWAFNEEVVARAIFESELPIVSGVGHEIDFTISDFVADVRAATPSAAAEIITEGVYSSCQFIGVVHQRIGELAKQRFNAKRQEQMRSVQRLARVHPRRRLNDQLQHLDDLKLSLVRSLRNNIRQRRLAFRQSAERLIRLSPQKLIKQRCEKVTQIQEHLRERAHARLVQSTNQVKGLGDRLRLLGPEQVLGRGYSITFDAASGGIFRRADEAKTGQRLRTRLQRGEIQSRVD